MWILILLIWYRIKHKAIWLGAIISPVADLSPHQRFPYGINNFFFFN